MLHLTLRNRPWMLTVAGIVLGTAVAVAQQAKRVDDAALRNAGSTGEEWLTHGMDPGDRRLRRVPRRAHGGRGVPRPAAPGGLTALP